MASRPSDAIRRPDASRSRRAESSDPGATSDALAPERLFALWQAQRQALDDAHSGGGLVVVDGRSHRSRARAHLPGSHHIPAGLLVSGEWPDGDLLLVTETDAEAERIREAMQAGGYQRRLLHLAGGFEAWLQAGLPVVVRQNRRWSLPPWRPALLRGLRVA